MIAAIPWNQWPKRLYSRLIKQRNGGLANHRLELTAALWEIMSPQLSLSDKCMRFVMRKSSHFRSPVNFLRIGVCFLAVNFSFTLQTSGSADTFPRAAPPVNPVASDTSSSASPNPLLQVLRFELQRKNPRIHHVAVVELRPFPFHDPRKYLMIGWGDP